MKKYKLKNIAIKHYKSLPTFSEPNKKEYDFIDSLNLPDSEVEINLNHLSFNALFDVITREGSKDKIKSKGVVRTPDWLAQHIVKGSFDMWNKTHRSSRPPVSIADVCCGHGVFLKEIKNTLKEKNYKSQVYGYENDLDELKFAKLFSWATQSNFNFVEGDFLKINKDLFSTNDTNLKHDIIISNPPYINSSKFDKGYLSFLKKSYQSVPTGSFDISILFVEQIAKMLTKGGIASIILTNKFMTSAYGKKFCSYLSNNYRVLKIEDFNHAQLFRGYTTYTCIITFANLKPTKRFLVNKYFEDIDHSNPKIKKQKFVSFPYEQLLSHPWSFASGTHEEIIKICTNKRFPILNDVFGGIYQGMRTGSNQSFLISKNKIGTIEKEITKPFINAKNIKDFLISAANQFIIFPYKQGADGIERIEEKEFKSKYPYAYAHLRKHKSTLENRSLQHGARWFEYSRTQNFSEIKNKKILVKEMMPASEFSADIKGNNIFASGYALNANNMSDEEVVSWTIVLSTPIMEFILRHFGTQLHSGWFRLMKQHLKSVHLPLLSKNDHKKIYRVFKTKKSRRTSIEMANNIVAKSFGIDKKQIKFVYEYLSRIHKISKSQKNSSVINYEPVKIKKYNKFHSERFDLTRKVTFVENKNLPIHNWYKFTQGYSADLVETLLNELNLKESHTVLDPFNGCGTTTTVCSFKGINSIGIEISPLMSEVARIKSRNWNINKLNKFISSFKYKDVNQRKYEKRDYIFTDYLVKAYSEKNLTKLKKIANYFLKEEDKEIKDFCMMGFLSILEDVSLVRKHGSHYRFLNNDKSIGLQKLNIETIDNNADIFKIFKLALRQILDDIEATEGGPLKSPKIICGDSKSTKLNSNSIDLVITSPPYLNRNNYIAQQKAELDFLQMIDSKNEYKEIVKSTFRSHTDSELPKDSRSSLSEINAIIKSIQLEEGNNMKIPHMISGYFDDMNNLLIELFRLVKKGGQCAFVLGNTRWGGIVVPVDHLVVKIAENIGFRCKKILVTRYKGNSPQQMKKYGRIPVRESIIIFSK